MNNIPTIKFFEEVINEIDTRTDEERLKREEFEQYMKGVEERVKQRQLKEAEQKRKYGKHGLIYRGSKYLKNN